MLLTQVRVHFLQEQGYIRVISCPIKTKLYKHYERNCMVLKRVSTFCQQLSTYCRIVQEVDQPTGSIHRGFLESTGLQNSCDHANDKWQSAASLELMSACMPADACNFHALWESAGSWLSPNAFKWFQKILCTIKRARSLENLYGSTYLLEEDWATRST